MTLSGVEKDRATTEAAGWLVALEDAPDDPSLRAQFDTWLQLTPANVDAWKNTKDVYDMMAKAEPAYERIWRIPATDLGARNHPTLIFNNRAISAKQRQSSLRSRLAIMGLSVAAAAACLMFLAPALLLHLRADYLTSTAEIRLVRLEDGSTIQLAPESAIDVSFDGVDRRIHLLKGEAFFQVTHDPARPFQVVSNDVKTTDIGTAFDVRLEGDETIVAVREGRVRVDYQDSQQPASAELEQGDWIQIDRYGKPERNKSAPDEIAPWLDNQIIARDRPIGEVINDLRRYYSGMIVLRDAGLGDERVTGVYNASNPVQALQAVVGPHGGVVRQLSPWILVLSRQ